MRRSPLVAALVVVVLLTAFAGATTGSPQPDPVCSICEDSALDDHRGQSVVTVDIRENGDAEWRIEVEIDNATVAEELHRNPPELSQTPGTALVEASYEEPAVTVTDDDDVLVVEFVDRDAVRSPAGGTLLVDYLHGMDVAGGYEMNVDRFELRGPEGYVVSNDPERAVVTGNAATWNGNSYNIYGTFVVFAPEDAGAKDLRTAAAKGVVLAPVAMGNLPIVLLPAGIFGVLLGTVGAGTRWVAETLNPRRLGVGAVAAAVLGALSIPELFRIAEIAPYASGWALVPAVVLIGVGLVKTDRQTATLAILCATGLFALEFAALIRIAGPVSAFALPVGVMGAILVPVVAAPLLIAAGFAETLRADGR